MDRKVLESKEAAEQSSGGCMYVKGHHGPKGVEEFMEEKKVIVMQVSGKEGRLLKRAKDAKFVETVLGGGYKIRDMAIYV